MTDLYLGVAIMTALSVLLAVVTARVTRNVPNRLCDLLALLTIMLIVAYIVWLWDDITLAHLLPFSNLIIVGNWMTLLAGVLAGLVWRRLRKKSLRRVAAVSLLAVIGFYALVQPILGDPPECEDRWQRDVCLQTSDVTCSAAAAAMLLAAHGIPATEQEMARLCLTRNGTTWKGIYRGLKLKTADTPYDVEIFNEDVDTLRRSKSGPFLLKAELQEDAPVPPIYHEEWGWIPGQPHSVVLFEFLDNGDALIGDPSIGLEAWSVKDLQVLWHGQGLRLVRRDAT
ncbi:hypothetical protein Mal4_46610 [Maioricimonas rarisocia]|uniref:Peptidase C39 domain-containing protein n=1 Tax=Maioricimonas rarisocia TaxID=2528026 RepID=A0A517ZCW6_9PLAN|nr:cysteine peptidase family C39 domain-containing protein [Maioricimonas rarisocia]QDU40305.1 hypothetical protein Mal4_46610 [Maioricimonas rarisocia]